jgi:hypothetical protein
MGAAGIFRLTIGIYLAETRTLATIVDVLVDERATLRPSR